MLQSSLQYLSNSARPNCHSPNKLKKHCYNICTTSAQRLRRCSNIVQILYKCFVFTGSTLNIHHIHCCFLTTLRLIYWPTPSIRDSSIESTCFTTGITTESQVTCACAEKWTNVLSAKRCMYGKVLWQRYFISLTDTHYFVHTNYFYHYCDCYAWRMSFTFQNDWRNDYIAGCY